MSQFQFIKMVTASSEYTTFCKVTVLLIRHAAEHLQ